MKVKHKDIGAKLDRDEWEGEDTHDITEDDFLHLDDTPSSYSGQGGKGVQVKATEDGLELIKPPVGDRLIWKDASENALTLLNQTADTDWTDLDLTAYTSVKARFALLNLSVLVDALPTYRCLLVVRKNGTEPATWPGFNVPRGTLMVGQVYFNGSIIVALDDAQKVEYIFQAHNSGQFDIYIDVLGYIE